MRWTSSAWYLHFERGWQQHFHLAEGACEGVLTGRYRGATYPLRGTNAGPFRPDLRGVIETDDGTTVMFESHGYGRVHPVGERQIVGTVLHLSDASSTPADAAAFLGAVLRAAGE